jgi:hypothetical protein
MPIMVQFPFLVVVLDLPDFPQWQIVNEAVLAAVVHELELMERMGVDRPHLFVLARHQNPVVEIWYGDGFFHQKKRQKLTLPLAGKLLGEKKQKPSAKTSNQRFADGIRMLKKNALTRNIHSTDRTLEHHIISSY